MPTTKFNGFIRWPICAMVEGADANQNMTVFISDPVVTIQRPSQQWLFIGRGGASTCVCMFSEFSSRQGALK